MQYADMLRKLFQGIELNVEDLLFLESFQIGYLPDRAPRRELAELLRATPVIRRYLVSMCPSIVSFVDEILREENSNNKTIEQNCDDLLWEIADLIIYSKYPEAYDRNVEFPWEINEIVPPQYLQGKVVIDAGAGPGRISFLLAQYARTVFAVEPTSGFRRLIRQKTLERNITNIYTVDGVLDSLPFPDHSVDYLMTSQAIGWNLQAELCEVERVLKPDGCAIHLFSDADAASESVKGIHGILTSSKYECTKIKNATGTKLKYQMTMKGL